MIFTLRYFDAAFLFNVVPESVQNLNLTDLERYFVGAWLPCGEKGMYVLPSYENGLNTSTTIMNVPKFEKQQKLNLLVTRF